MVTDLGRRTSHASRIFPAGIPVATDFYAMGLHDNSWEFPGNIENSPQSISQKDDITLPELMHFLNKKEKIIGVT